MKTIFTLLAMLSINSAYAIAGGNVVDMANVTPDDPASAVVQIQSKFNDGNISLCTGVIIEHNKILTANHCIYENHKIPAVKTRIVFNTSAGTQYSYVTKYHATSDSWQALNDIKNGNMNGKQILADVAVLEIGNDVPYPYHPLKVANHKYDNALMFSYGFGGTYGDFNKGKLNVAVTFIQSELPYDIMALNGGKLIDTPDQNGNIHKVYAHICSEDSGGPDIQMIDGIPQVVGIHNGFISTSGTPTCTEDDNDTMNTQTKYVSTDVTFYGDYLLIQKHLDNPQPYPGVN